MWCPECGFKNRNSAKFCADCGTGLIRGQNSTSSGVIAVSRPVPLQPSDISGNEPLKTGYILDGRYRILEHLATGGMGAIYRGEDVRLNARVAIKEMLDFSLNDQDRQYAVKRFQEEALLLAGLRHSNIPRVTDHFTEKARCYLIMDFIDGKSAERILQENQNRGLPERRVLKWGLQICDVLHYLHTQNPPVIYRDMKPSNIMVCSGDRIMLIDFGIARHFQPQRQGTMIGTHGYAPPEQYKGQTEPRSDIYALASTLYHLLSGYDPTQGVPFRFAPIRNLSFDLSEDIEDLLMKALQTLPENRYQSAKEMKSALSSLLESGTGYSAVPRPAPPIIPIPQADIKPAEKPPTPRYTNRQKSSTVSRSHFQRGKNFFDTGDLPRAKKELEKALTERPNYPEALSLLGYILLKMGRNEEAVFHLNQAVSLNPDCATAHLYLGKAYARMGMATESQKAYHTAMKLDPGILRMRNRGLVEKLIRSFLS